MVRYLFINSLRERRMTISAPEERTNGELLIIRAKNIKNGKGYRL